MENVSNTKFPNIFGKTGYFPVDKAVSPSDSTLGKLEYWPHIQRWLDALCYKFVGWPVVSCSKGKS